MKVIRRGPTNNTNTTNPIRAMRVIVWLKIRRRVRIPLMPEKKRKKYWVGFDLGGTKMLANVFDSDFKLAARARKKTQSRNGASIGTGEDHPDC